MSAAIHDTPTPTTGMTTPAGAKREGDASGGTAPPRKIRKRLDISEMVEESIDAESMMTHMQPEIRNLPFDETDNTGEEEENSNGSNNEIAHKIRLTPTEKLMPAPNPVDPKRKFVCPYENCTKSYGKSSHLRSHLTWHTGIKPFVCQEPNCGKGFTRSDELNRHTRTHTGEKPFECVQCTKKFSRSDHLTKHLATHAKQMQNPLPKRIPDEKKEKEKKKVNLALSQSLPDFHDSMHFLGPFVDNMPERKGRVSDESTNKFKPEATKNSKSKKITNSHIDEDDAIPAEMMIPVSTMLCPSSPDTQQTDLNDDAIMPEANAELLSDEMMNQNNIEKQFGVPPHLVQFIERPFRCTQCEKSFKRQDDLTRHLRTHTGEKPFSCTYADCGKRFVRNEHLKKHLQTHFKQPTGALTAAVAASST